MEIAKTIYNQIGGNKMAAMVGITNLAGSENSLHFGFKGCRKANKCRITLNSLDLYDIAFFKYNQRTGECPQVKSIPSVYNDQLTKSFENFTGLYTSL